VVFLERNVPKLLPLSLVRVKLRAAIKYICVSGEIPSNLCFQHVLQMGRAQRCPSACWNKHLLRKILDVAWLRGVSLNSASYLLWCRTLAGCSCLYLLNSRGPLMLYLLRRWTIPSRCTLSRRMTTLWQKTNSPGLRSNSLTVCLFGSGMSMKTYQILLLPIVFLPGLGLGESLHALLMKAQARRFRGSSLHVFSTRRDPQLLLKSLWS